MFVLGFFHLFFAPAGEYRDHLVQPLNHHVTHSVVFCLFLQIGTFTTHSGQFFLEPLLSADGEEYEEEHNKPHLVYRQDADRKSRDTQPCTTSGNSFRLPLAIAGAETRKYWRGNAFQSSNVTNMNV